MRAYLIGLSLLALAVTPLAAAPEPYAARKDGLHNLGAAVKNVRDELKSASPQMFIIQLSARQIRQASVDQYRWFPAGSGHDHFPKSNAKPEIWTQPAKFKAAQDEFATQAQAFFKVAASGDKAKIETAMKPLGLACKSCHNSFKIEEK